MPTLNVPRTGKITISARLMVHVEGQTPGEVLASLHKQLQEAELTYRYRGDAEPVEFILTFEETEPEVHRTTPLPNYIKTVRDVARRTVNALHALGLLSSTPLHTAWEELTQLTTEDVCSEATAIVLEVQDQIDDLLDTIGTDAEDMVNNANERKRELKELMAKSRKLR